VKRSWTQQSLQRKESVNTKEIPNSSQGLNLNPGGDWLSLRSSPILLMGGAYIIRNRRRFCVVRPFSNPS
jgi:hypothetical protein